MSVTLKQIAEEVGVSQPLVTYALNNKAGVSQEMRLKILSTAQRLGYEKGANPEAQALAAKRHGRRLATGVIALLYSRRDDMPLMSTPFYHAFLEGVEFETEQRQLDLLITPLRDQKLPRLAREGKVDGLIFASINAHIGDEMRGLNLPAITLSTHYPPFYNLLPDNEVGTYEATKFLIEQGHRHIAYLGMDHPPGLHKPNAQSSARYAGYRRALAQFGLDYNPQYFYNTPPLLEANGQMGFDQLLAQTGWQSGQTPIFTALVCHNDLIAMGAVRQAQHRGFHVPNDLSVVGFDDISTLYNFQPALTSVAFSRFDMGRRAVEWVCTEFQALSDAPEPLIKPISGIEKFPVSLSVRDSTRAPQRASRSKIQ